MADLEWADVPALVHELALLAAAPAWDIKQASACVFTRGDVGYHYAPHLGEFALHARGATPADLARCKMAAARAVGADSLRGEPLGDAEVASGHWLKLAYSPALRRAGEYLNFFPGEYPGGIPNAPSPLAAMLTTALIGGGLGYVGGRAVKSILPESVGKKLPRSGAVAGATAGSLLAAPWMLANYQQGMSQTDGSLLAPKESDVYSPEADSFEATSHEDRDRILKQLKRHDPIHIYDAGLPKLKKAGDDVEIGSAAKAAVVAFYLKLAGDSFDPAQGPRQPPTSLDVNIGNMGQTLWESGADPRQSAMAMGTMLVAQQLPDPNARPGWVTGHQLGQLAANAASNYATGLIAGAVLNTVVGTPWRAPAYGTGAAALGLIGAVVPKLFG